MGSTLNWEREKRVWRRHNEIKDLPSGRSTKPPVTIKRRASANMTEAEYDRMQLRASQKRMQTKYSRKRTAPSMPKMPWD